MPTDKNRKTIRWDLYVITDEALGGGRSHEEQARAAVEGGAGLIQLRDKTASSRRLYEAARAIREVTRAAGALLIVNDRLDIALAADADGLHVGPDDLPVSVARRLLRAGMILGASSGTVEEAIAAERDGADYLGVGAVYEARGSKADAGPPVGPTRVRAIRQVVQIPIVGIGGIKVENAAPVIEAGADGVAVITGVVAAPDIRAAAARFVEMIQDEKRGGGRA
ncbi:MAG: thiamine phosphate synthase [Dehalococcoidia bacterium]